MPVTGWYRSGTVASLLGVSPDTVRRLVDSGELTGQRSDGGHRLIEAASIARYMHGTSSGAPAAPANRLLGIVTGIERDRLVARVHLQAGPHQITSLLATEELDRRGLEPGDLAHAVLNPSDVVVAVAREP